jgi:hypothetical protein
MLDHLRWRWSRHHHGRRQAVVPQHDLERIETMYKTFLQGQLKYDARMPGRDVKLTNGEPPAAGDPRLATYLEMQSETRSLLGLLLWVSLAYPQISYHVNRACGFAAYSIQDAL